MHEKNKTTIKIRGTSASSSIPWPSNILVDFASTLQLERRLRQFLLIFARAFAIFTFWTRTATGSELFSLLTCPHTTTFTLLSIFFPLEMSRIKIWETYGPSTRSVLFQFTCRPRFKNARAKLPNTRENPLCMNEEFLTISVLSRELLVICSIAVVVNILVWSLFSIS